MCVCTAHVANYNVMWPRNRLSRYLVKLCPNAVVVVVVVAAAAVVVAVVALGL